MATPIAIDDVRALEPWIEPMAAEAAAEGFGFVDRLAREWQSGENTFCAAGERFLLARVDGQAAGICGLNRDASAPDGATGRLRHLYVRPAWRRQGVGKALVEEVLGSARSSFSRVRLRTDTAAAGAFYGALGFAGSTEPNATHVYVFRC
jgi:GNAT superfamily N-acetyltransferase